MEIGGIASSIERTDRDSSENIEASADQKLSMPACGWDGRRAQLGRIEELLHRAMPGDYDDLVQDVHNTQTVFTTALVRQGMKPDQAEWFLEEFLRAAETVVRSTGFRMGYKKFRDDATVPEVAANLTIASFRLVAEAFSSRGMAAYRNRNFAFIQAMAEFAEEANGGMSSHKSFYTTLGKEVARVVLDHKIGTHIPKLAPTGVDYQEIAVAALTQLVYFIQSGDGGPIKIGIARDPASRLANLQTAHHEDLKILAITPGGAEQERAYHEQFVEHRRRGEWFSPAPEILAEIDRLSSPKASASGVVG